MVSTGEGVPMFSKRIQKDLINLHAEGKCDLINAFWPHLQLSSEDYIEDQYAEFILFVGTALGDLFSHRSKFIIHDLKSLRDIVGKLRTYQTLTRETIVREIKNDYLDPPGPPHDDNIIRSVELAIRLWLGLNISSRAITVGPRNPRNTCVQWEDDQSINQAIALRFQQKASRGIYDEETLDESLTIANLQRICRLHIRWTDNLVDHLRLKGPRGDRSLSIYRHKICLLNNLEDPNMNAIGNEVLREAMRTLDFLFPLGDPRTTKFLKREGVHLHSIPSPEQAQPIDLNEFKYWRNDLARLLKLLYGPPESVTQTLLDTRNIAQFATIWLAIFGVLGLTILFGVLATVYTIKQYRVAILSYELALAAACYEYPDLGGFCIRPLPTDGARIQVL